MEINKNTLNIPKTINSIVELFIKSNSKLPVIESGSVIICSDIDFKFDNMSSIPDSLELTLIDYKGNVKKAKFVPEEMVQTLIQANTKAVSAGLVPMVSKQDSLIHSDNFRQS